MAFWLVVEQLALDKIAWAESQVDTELQTDYKWNHQCDHSPFITCSHFLFKI